MVVNAGNTPSRVPRRRARTEAIRRFVLEHGYTAHKNVATAVMRRFRISRQAANRHIAALVKEGALMPSGHTRARTYTLAYSDLAQFEVPLEPGGVEEHREWLDRVAPVLPELPRNVRALLNHSFSEMMNNAIDHSGGATVWVRVQESAATIRLSVGDDGVGVFRKLQDAFGLPDAQAAVLELSKGKVTTDPARHTGEGIFFTSRMCDKFSMFSSNLGWVCVPNRRVELVVEFSPGEGTLVMLEVEKWSERTTAAVFDEYTSGDDNLFSRTTVPILIAAFAEDTLVSRSAARRVLARLEKFKEVMLDFDGVDEIGQPFADEIFRVFSREHPEVSLRPINANKRVMGMVRRAQQTDQNETSAATG